MEFRCTDCSLIFTGESTKLEYRDPIYGPCSKIISNCPICGAESPEYRKPKQGKSQKQGEPSCPAYGSGGCSCCN